MGDKFQRKPNRLINETNPYLLQHAYNPVDWHPWGEPAFEKAKIENKPVFLSIGYSTCHWCHVMEKESFEDQTVADLMNDVFVSIKVDREERPDIDNIYMLVCQMMTGHGGWPLSIVMTPDKKPFFSGTYFPKESKYGRIGFIDLINRIDEVWRENKSQILESAEQITSALTDYSESSGELELPGNKIFTIAYEYFKNRYDRVNGGFGTRPKFPSPHNLLYLLRYWKYSSATDALEMVKVTLEKMRCGGIYDQIGDGFHRYSTDKEWLLPHFEKMLYDQAMLALAYLETYQVTGNTFYSHSVHDILRYVLRDLKNEDGVFFSAEDADSEGVEGKFYVWSSDELKTVMNDQDYEFICKIFNVKNEGNFVDESTHLLNGSNILNLSASVSNDIDISEKLSTKKFQTLKSILFTEREKRIHPFKDDKVMTDWNSLMIVALAKAARILKNSEYRKIAENAFRFITTELYRHGILFHTYKKGKAAIKGNIDDYAFLIWGALELYESTFNPDYLETAIILQQKQIELFEDGKNGGFYFTPVDGENLLIRTKEIHDGAIPSGNSISFLNLVKLFRITRNPTYETVINKLVAGISPKINESPAGSTMFLSAFNFLHDAPMEIIYVSPESDSFDNEIKEYIDGLFLPNKIILYISPSISEKIAGIAPYLSNYKTVDNKFTVYICKDLNCKLPVNTLEDVKGLLSL